MRRTLVVAMTGWMVAASAGLAATNAADSAAAYVAWTNGATGVGAVGFGPWILERTTNDDSRCGFLLGNSTWNGYGTNTVPDDDINTDGKAWGLYANSGQTASARRLLEGGALQVGQTVEVWMDNGEADGGSAIGVGLQNALGNNVVEVMFRGGQSTYEFSSGGLLVDSGFPYNGFDGVKVSLTLTSFTTFTGTVSRGVASVGIGGMLMNPDGGPVVMQVRFFNFNAGGGIDVRNHYFNTMSVSAAPPSPAVPAPAISAVGVTNANYVVTWSATNTVIYDVMVSTDLVADAWVALMGGSNLVGYGSSLSISDAPRPVAFYRIRQRDS